MNETTLRNHLAHIQTSNRHPIIKRNSPQTVAASSKQRRCPKKRGTFYIPLIKYLHPIPI